MTITESPNSNGKRFSDETLAVAASKRNEHRVVARYIQALENGGGDWVYDPEVLNGQLAEVDTELETATGIDRLMAIQRRLEIETAIGQASTTNGFDVLEAEFIEHVAAWADRKGVSYKALRQAGVPAKVLKAAGVGRSAA